MPLDILQVRLCGHVVKDPRKNGRAARQTGFNELGNMSSSDRRSVETTLNHFVSANRQQLRLPGTGMDRACEHWPVGKSTAHRHPRQDYARTGGVDTRSYHLPSTIHPCTRAWRASLGRPTGDQRMAVVEAVALTVVWKTVAGQMLPCSISGRPVGARDKTWMGDTNRHRTGWPFPPC